MMLADENFLYNLLWKQSAGRVTGSLDGAHPYPNRFARHGSRDEHHQAFMATNRFASVGQAINGHAQLITGARFGFVGWACRMGGQGLFFASNGSVRPRM